MDSPQSGETVAFVDPQGNMGKRPGESGHYELLRRYARDYGF